MNPTSKKSMKTVLAVLVMLAVFSAIPAFATTHTVTSLADSGSGTLRDAIAAATAGDTINFSVTGTITLTSNEIHTYQNLTITGPGASSLTISGGGTFRVFENDSATVSISGVTISNGTGFFGVSGVGGGVFNAGTMTLTAVTLTSNTAVEGGAIVNEGTLTLTNSTISNNTSPCPSGCGGQGGGIFNYGTLTVSGSTISNNAAGSDGGGIWNSPSAGGGSAGTATITNSTISGNSAIDEAGGIFNGSGGTLTITNSTISGNSSPGGKAGANTVAGQSGGIENQGAATISGSTISGNTSGGGTGGITNNSSTLTMINSTVSGNTAGFNGGGVMNNAGTIALSFVTISGNRANTWGNCGGCGGFHGDNIANNATATLKSSIVANSGSVGNCYVFPSAPAIVSQGYNLSDETTCATYFNQSTDQNNVATAGLGPLQNNGGLTQTMALLAGSPAVDAIPVSPTNFCTDISSTVVTTDQRGIARPQPAGGNCDIGAFELVPSSQTTPTITFGSAPTPTYLGPNFTVSATTTNTDSATLTFSVMSGPCTFVSETATTGTFSSTGAGTCVVTASGAATTNFLAASNTQAVIIAKATPTITFGAAPTPTFPGVNFTVSASTTNTDSATLTFSVISGPCALVSGATISSSGAGNCVVKASGGVTTNFLAASNTQSVTISPATPAQLVSALITTLQGMNITGQGTSLTDQLKQVQIDITTNNGLACQDLLLFVNHVKAQSGRKITVAQANQLLVAAAAIQAALGC